MDFTNRNLKIVYPKPDPVKWSKNDDLVKLIRNVSVNQLFSNALILTQFKNRERLYNEWLVYFLRSVFSSDIGSILIKDGHIHIYLKNDNVYDIVFFLKNNSAFCINQLLDFTLVDRLEMNIPENKRFEFIYVFSSTFLNHRIFIRGFISAFGCLKSLVSLFDSANWLEREVWDLYGVIFVGHPDLRRILTDYGFSGYPFRKDFPLTGYVELRFDEINKSVVVEPLELSQEFRFFKFENPWKK